VYRSSIGKCCAAIRQLWRFHYGPADAAARFSRWLAGDEHDEALTITSSAAYVR
jgi:hypothetical protein